MGNQIPFTTIYVFNIASGRTFSVSKLWHFHKNIRLCVENECCCPRTVSILNVNFTSKYIYIYNDIACLGVYDLNVNFFLVQCLIRLSTSIWKSNDTFQCIQCRLFVIIRWGIKCVSGWTVQLHCIVNNMMTSSNGNIFRVTGPLRGNPSVTGGFPHKCQRRWALIFCNLRLNRWLSKQSGRQWFEMLSRSLTSLWWKPCVATWETFDTCTANYNKTIYGI